MRKLVILMVLVFVWSCTNKKEGTKFNPQEKESVFASDSDRQKAIEKKRAQLDSLQLDIQTLVFENNIKLSVLPPAPKGDITMEVSKAMATKMMQITAQNGIGGFGNSPAFVLATAWIPTGRATTGTVPQKMTTKYKITFLVANALTGDVYATYEQEVMGVGNSFEEAAMNVVNEVKNTSEMQQMLKTTQEKILAWYNGNAHAFKSMIDKLVADGDYATAYALLASVPKEAKTCFTFANGRIGKVIEGMKNQKAEETLTEMKNAIAAAGDRYSPMVAGSMKMLPADSKQMKEAQTLFANYNKHLQDVRADSVAHERKVEMEKLAMEQLKIKYGVKSSMEFVEKSGNSNNGSFFNGSSDEGEKGGIASSIKKHPFLWGLGAGAVVTGVAGIALYGSLPFLSKIGLALL